MEFDLSDAFVEAPNGTSTGALVKPPFYLNPRKRVNTILTHFVRRRAHARSGETTSHRRDAAAHTRAGAKPVRTAPLPIAKNVVLAKIATV